MEIGAPVHRKGLNPRFVKVPVKLNSYFSPQLKPPVRSHFYLSYHIIDFTSVNFRHEYLLHTN